MSCLWNVLSMKCSVYEKSCLWKSCLLNVLSMKCPVYEMSCLWNVLSMKCPWLWYVLSIKIPWLWNVLFLKCPVYETSCLRNVPPVLPNPVSYFTLTSTSFSAGTAQNIEYIHQRPTTTWKLISLHIIFSTICKSKIFKEGGVSLKSVSN